MANVARLKRKKKRLTRTLIKLDEGRFSRDDDTTKDKPVREHKWLRARLFKIDTLLEQKGAL